jgi:hypothetical protein
MKPMDGPWTQGNSMPGWGIVADLTPPELIASRRMRVIRRLMIVAVAAVVLLCAGGYTLAIWQHNQASDELASEQDRTTSLLGEQRRYSGVTVVRGAIADVQGQLAGLMVADVNVGALIGAVASALPKGMSIDQLAVTISAPTPTDKFSTGKESGGLGGLDLSDAAHIGTVTLSGTGSKLTDLAAYVDALRKTTGVFEPYPQSNQTTDTGTTYSLQLTLTDALLTHRYDAQDGGR